MAIPGKRKKWSHVRQMLDRLSWIRLECLDPRGKTLDIIDNDEPAEDLEDLDGYGGQVHQLTALMLRAQDVALRRNAEQNRQSNEMVLELCKVLMARLTSLEKGFASNLALAQRYVKASAGEDDDGLLSDPLVGALAPALLQRLMGAGTPSAGNGQPPDSK
jgi:hypothetical protein